MSARLSDVSGFCVDVVEASLLQDAVPVCVLAAVSALLSLLSCVTLVCDGCRVRGGTSVEAVASSFWCFVGSLCSTAGSLLCRQRRVVIVMGWFSAILDVVHFLSLLFPLCWHWDSKAEKRLRMMRRRRMQHLLAVCVLLVLGGGSLTSRMRHGEPDRPSARRKLLHIFLQDNTEVLGYTLGLLSLVVACLSRFPASPTALRREKMMSSGPFSTALSSLAGVLYSAVILLCHTDFGLLLRALPWLLAAACGAVLDLLILVFYWWKGGARRRPDRWSPESQHLLWQAGGLSKDRDSATVKRHRKQQVCVKAVKETSERRLLRRTVAEVEICSSSYDSSSSPSSDLEWDFEAANTIWCKPAAKPEKGDEFPLQEWPRNPEPFVPCTGGRPGLPEKTANGRQPSEPGSVAGVG